jgi:hypothetical protein
VGLFAIRYIPAALLLAGVAWVCFWVFGLVNANAALEARVAALHNDLMTCGARLSNITEDMQSDATVNDPNDFDVPPHWLRTEGTDAGN